MNPEMLPLSLALPVAMLLGMLVRWPEEDDAEGTLDCSCSGVGCRTF